VEAVAVPPKLMPAYKPGEIVEVLTGGRYKVRIGSRIDKVISKERNQLGKRLANSRLAAAKVKKTQRQAITDDTAPFSAQASPRRARRRPHQLGKCGRSVRCKVKGAW